MELLSPAGSYASAISSIKGGADAIYLGGKLFSARMSSENFDNDELRDIINYAHLRQVKVYVTINTLIYQDEFDECVAFCKFLVSIKVDAIIVQDLGLAYYLHQVLPQLELHASTQLSCHNLLEAKALQKVGFTRIVIARESNLRLIKEIKKIGLEVEVFIHGALCVSYSGNCLMSSFIGGRSGNRGRCAQPCRMNYRLVKNNEEISDDKFMMSTKDLMTLDYLEAICATNVDSLKIEGRLKQSEYAYLTTLSYRHALDAIKEHKQNKFLKTDKENLMAIFSRKFTKGFIDNESPFELLNQETSSHQGEEIGKVTYVKNSAVSILLTKKVHRLDGIRFNNKTQLGLQIGKMFINGVETQEANPGDTIVIKGINEPKNLFGVPVIRTSNYLLLQQVKKTLESEKIFSLSGTLYAYINKPLTLEFDFANQHFKVESGNAERALNSGTSFERIKEQMAKSGTFPYAFNDLTIKSAGEVFIPISHLNKLRNQAFSLIEDYINTPQEVIANEYQTDIVSQNNNELETDFIVTNQKQLNSLSKQKVYATFLNNLNERVEENYVEHDSIMTNFFYEGKDLIASMYNNITNSYTLDCYYHFGFNECMLSLEIDENSLKLLIDDYYHRHQVYPCVSYLIYGRIDLMVTKSCIIGTFNHNKALHCEACHQNDYALRDRINATFPLIGDAHCSTRVLNAYPLYLVDKIKELSSLHINKTYALFTLENDDEVTYIFNNIKDNMNDITSIMDNNYTRGHFVKRAL